MQRAEKTLCLVGQNGLRMYSGHGGAVAPAMVYGQISTARKYLGQHPANTHLAYVRALACGGGGRILLRTDRLYAPPAK